jgi:predicted SAM-dependent methyltransferase
MIYILLPVHNRIEETKKVTNALKRQTYTDYELILVDDGCADGTVEYVTREIINVTVITGNGNLWWAGCLEKAKKHLSERKDIKKENIVVILNNDIIFDANFLLHIDLDMTENQDSLIAPKCYSQENHELIDDGIHVDWRKLTFKSAKNRDEINVLSTRGLYMSYEIFSKIGHFHPFLLPHYGSDYEFTHRAYKKGFPLKVSQRTAVFLNRETTGIRNIDFNISFLEILNNLIISKKSVYNRVMWTSFILLSCKPKYIPLNLLRIHIGTGLILIKWIYYRLKDILLRAHIFMNINVRKKIKVIIGSGGNNLKGWISTDIDQLDITNKEDWLKYFKRANIDVIIAEHVWEHLTEYGAKMAAQNCYNFLKTGGYIRVAVPDGHFPDKEYIKRVKPMGSGPGADDHKVLYNYKTLSGIFVNAGFNVKLLEYWDENGQFHSTSWNAEDGLIRRSSVYDTRNKNGKLEYTSIILDAEKN